MTWHSITISMGWLAVASGVVGTSYQLRRVRALGVEGVSLATWVLFVYMGCFWITYGFAARSVEVVLGSALIMPLSVVDPLSSRAVAPMGGSREGPGLLRALLRDADDSVGLGRWCLRYRRRDVDQPRTATDRIGSSSRCDGRVRDVVVCRSVRVCALDSVLHRGSPMGGTHRDGFRRTRPTSPLRCLPRGDTRRCARRRDRARGLRSGDVNSRRPLGARILLGCTLAGEIHQRSWVEVTNELLEDALAISDAWSSELDLRELIETELRSSSLFGTSVDVVAIGKAAREMASPYATSWETTFDANS